MSESKKIQGSDLIAPGYLKDAIAEAEKFLDVITSTKKVIIETNKATAQKLKDSKGSDSKALKEQNALMAESNKQRKLAVEAEKLEIKATLDLEKAKKALADFEKKKLMDDEKGRKMIEAQSSAYAQASKRLNDLRKEYKDLAIAGKAGEKATQELLKTIQDLDKELKKVDASVGQFNREVGNYKESVKEALIESEAFSDGIKDLGKSSNIAIQGLSGIYEQLKKVRDAQKAAENGAGKLSKALKIGGIGLLLTAIAAISAFFKSSREGGLQFELMLNKLKGTLDVVVGSLAALGSGLVDLGEAVKLFFSGDFTAASTAASKGVDKMSKAFDGNGKAIVEQIKGYDELTKEIFAFEDALRRQQIRLNEAKMDEEDYNEIQNDTTISLNEQKAALESAIAARLQQAKIQKEIANKELDIASKELELELRKNKAGDEAIKILKQQGYEAFLNSKFTTKVSEEALQKIQEKNIAEKEAADVLDDLDRQEAERRRQIIQTETIAQIELIRSKKLGADAQVQILTKQVADEKEQLEDREKFQEELRRKQLEAQAEEIKLLERFGLTQDEVLDLINEKDAVRLANKLKNLRATRLSEEQETELAKVILEAQNAEIAHNSQIEKFEEERIKRQQKIVRLEQEIAVINENSVLDEVTRIEQERQQILNISNAKILQDENVFNKKLIAQRKDAFFQEQAILRERYRIQQDLLFKQYEIDRANINQTITDNKIKEKELEKLDAAYYQNKQKIEADQQKLEAELAEKELIEAKLRENRKTEIIVTRLQQATQALSDELDRRQAIQNNRAEYQIQKTETLIQRQQDLAARGLANTLAYQQAQLDKQQLAQQDAAKKQAKQKEALQLADALFNAYNNELKQTDPTGKPVNNPTTAAGKALADVLILKGIAAGLVQFAAEGNNDVQGPGTTTSDSIPFMLSKHEGVVKAEANLGNPGVVAALNSGTFDQMYMPKYDLETVNNSGNTAQNISNSLIIQKNDEIISLLKKIESKPVQKVEVDKLGNLIETVYKDGMKTVIKHKNRRSIG
jgi:hypothetical protein